MLAWFSRSMEAFQPLISPCTGTTAAFSRVTYSRRWCTFERFPQIKAPLEKLSGQLNNETMAALNAAVDLQGRRVEEVAFDFLRSRALLSEP